MSRNARVAVVILSILLVLNLAATGVLFFSVSDVEDRVAAVEEETSVVTDHLLRVGQLSGGESVNGSGSVSGVAKQSGLFLAHDSETNEGVAFEYEYQPLPGDSMYVDAGGVIVDPSFQESLQNSREAVRQSKYEPVTYGMAITLDAPEGWDYIRGESAGLAVVAEIAALDPRYERNESVVLTGQVEPDGSVVSVNYVTKKGEAAAGKGKTLIVAPHTSGSVDTEAIEVVHVQTVEEAMEYALDPANESATST